MSDFLRDLGFAVRSARRQPGPTTLAVLALAVAIGLTSSIFTLINAILLKPLPYRDSEQLVMVWAVNRSQGWDQEKMSMPELLDWQKTGLFEHVIGFVPNMNTITSPGEAELTHGYALSRGTFKMLGVSALIGRTFSEEEERPGGGNVVVLRHNIWQRRFGGDPNVVGRKILLNDRPFTVVGVMKPDFQFFNRQTEMFYPVQEDPAQTTGRFRAFRAMARMKAGLDVRDAQTRANVFAANFARQFPASNEGWTVNLVPLAQDTTGPVRPALIVLGGAVCLVLLIACANVANLLLIQGAARSKELAVRLALGAGRGRLIRQMLTESLLLSAIAGLLGFALTYGAVAYFRGTLPERFSFGRFLLQLDSIKIDYGVIAFTAVLAPLCSALAGIIPALRSSKPDFNEALKEAARGSASGIGARKLQSALIVAEVSAAVALTIGATLLVRSFGRLYDQGPGFKPEGLKTMMTMLPQFEFQARNPNDWLRQAEALSNRVFERVGTIPGVREVTSISQPPLTGFYYLSDFTIEGRAPTSPDDRPHAIDRWASNNYCQTLGIPLRSGRPFGPQDGRDTQKVALVNEPFAKRFFGGQDPLGRRVKFGNESSNSSWHTIVGVVGGERFAGMDEQPLPMVYFSRAQAPSSFFHMIVRSDMDLNRTVSLIRAELDRINPKISLYEIRTFDSILLDSTWRVRYSMMLLGVLAGASLLLSALGTFSVVSYATMQRTREIGIRMALGAQRRQVLELVTGDGFRVVVIGVALGLAIAAVLTRLMGSLLFGVAALDPLTFGAVGLAMIVVGIVACAAPAIRASHLEPVDALRHE